MERGEGGGSNFNPITQPSGQVFVRWLDRIKTSAGIMPLGIHPHSHRPRSRHHAYYRRYPFVAGPNRYVQKADPSHIGGIFIPFGLFCAMFPRAPQRETSRWGEVE
ncbi:hypothetical protein JTE90_024979 [Oedothorax gibbosus]|uniref:Uncharacterized protein n=1 Tax=Oedothorax gibbosus TaxID=931172 RepID=A0AAV6VUI6_9ARAC|nr:hypothetical protein JTE90_024979 [Oedothorax gibbosus]